MRLTDAELRTLIASNPRDPRFLDEMRARVTRQILQRLPNPTGRCPHGKRVEFDQRGSYSSGYPIHVTDDGRWEPGYCDAHKDIVMDPPSPERARLLALLRSL